MKNLLCRMLRGSFSCLFLLTLTASRIAFATVSTPQSRIEIAGQSLSVKSPPGWTVRPSHPGQTLVFEDPLGESHAGLSYNRNIAVAVQDEAKPIDSLEVKRLSERLRREAREDGTDFEVIDSRIIDYRTHADAILVYTVFKLQGVPMRQMHVFTSGALNSVLLTYTDFQETFEAEGSLDRVWEAMMSVDVAGRAPDRYDGLMYSGTGLAFLVTAAFFSTQLRNRQLRREQRAESSDTFDGDDDFEIIKRAGVDTWSERPARFAEASA